MGKYFKQIKQILAFILCVAILVSLAACGQQEAGRTNQNQPQNTANDKEKQVYYPEFIALNSEEDDGLLSNFILDGNDLYYCKNIYDEELNAPRDVMYKYSLVDGSVEKTWIKTQENGRITYCTADVHGNIYTIMNDVSLLNADEEGTPRMLLRKYNSQGAFLLELDMAELVDGLDEDTYIWDICVDDQKNIYISLSNSILLLNSEGKKHGVIEVSEDRPHNVFRGKDGVVYLEDTAMDGNVIFSQIDFEGKRLGDGYRNIPGTNNISVAWKKDFLLRDDSTVYEYELESETYEELFDWMDYDISGSKVRYMGLTEEGKIIAVVGDSYTNLIKLVKMNTERPTKEQEEADTESASNGTNTSSGTNASTVKKEKEEIVLGTVYVDYRLQDAVNAFNWSNDTYRVVIKNYWDNGIDYDTAITNIHKDLVSATNCPDILDLASLNMEKLASIGAVEDLTPYLEQSEWYHKEDFIDNVLEGVTFDGKIVAIPTGFTLSTVVGKSSVVGKEMGWSFEEMLMLAEKHPDSQLFHLGYQGGFIYDFMQYNQDAFVDWSAGVCNFDSEEFRKLLELASKFPAEADWSDSGKAMPEEKRTEKILLEKVEHINDYYRLQQYPALYGEKVTFIGFPTVDGSVGCTMNFENFLYGITTKSKHKDVAWAFIESYLTGSVEKLRNGAYTAPTFPVLKDILQEQINHLYYSDKDGNLVPSCGGYHIGLDDWQYECPPPTEEDIDLLLKLISVAKPTNDFGGDDKQIFFIVDEEAAAYFSGQKTMDEVIEIIQNRAQLFVNENS